MRKAISRKGQRRKQSQESGSPTNSVAAESATESSNHVKRKVTESEAVLTAKNYRLAKELSELRVRHRDESKNVTRLTMENMNLASRCREAISHVAMLKKELTMHQRRAAEALALQRKQNTNMEIEPVLSKDTQSSGAAATSAAAARAVDMGDEMDRIDRIMAAHAPPPPPPNPPSKVQVPPTDDKTDESPTGEFFSDYEVGKSGSGSSEEDVYKDNEMDLKATLRPIFPHTASPRVPSKANDYNEGFPNDLPISTRKKQIFRQAPPEIAEVDSEAGSHASSLSSVSENRRTIMSSIDAFEASFVTNFPETFSTSTGSENPESSMEIYNPFLPSPNRNPEVNPSETVKTRSAPLLPSRLEPRRPTRDSPPLEQHESPSTQTKSRGIGPVSVDTPVTPAEESVRQATPPSTRMALADVDGENVEKEGPRTPQSILRNNSGDDETPKRPEKTVSASARAKYEKALQPRGFVGRHASFKNGRSPKSDQMSGDAEVPTRAKSLSALLDEPENRITNKPPISETDMEEETEPGRIEPKKSSPTSSAFSLRSQSPSVVLKRLQARRAKELSPDDQLSPSPSVSTRGGSSLQAPAPIVQTPTKYPYSFQTSSPSTSRSIVSAPFPVTQPTTPEPSSVRDGVSNKPNQDDPQKANSREKNEDTAPREPNGITDTSASPSVSSAISVFEKAAKQNRTPVGSTGKVPFRSSFVSSPQVREASPVGIFMPSDEEESEAPFRDAQSFRRRTSSDGEDWSHPRSASARELQSFAKRTAVDFRGSNGTIDDHIENSSNSFPSRINNYTISHTRPGSTGAYTSPSQRSSTAASNYASTLRNSRRNVKQPVSYSEPPLNSKLRRGDVYFPKEDSKNADEVRKEFAASLRL